MLSPLPPDQADDDVAKLYTRLTDALELEALPESFHLYGRSPAFLKDLFMNVKKFVVGEGALSGELRSKIGLAVACHAKNAAWAGLFRDRLQKAGVDEQGLADVIAIASTNYMYNTFFKFRSLSGSDRFDGLPVGLRAHTFGGTSLPETEVELINIAVSDLNACEPCVSGHVAKAKQLDLKDAQMLEAVQVAGVVYAGAMYLQSASLA